ncbi:hypothetical protein MRX96_053492, partial [Rhipicephalus microplus]
MTMKSAKGKRGGTCQLKPLAKRQRREQDPWSFANERRRPSDCAVRRIRIIEPNRHKPLAGEEANPELRVKQAIAARKRREANPDLRVRQAIAARQRREANPELRVQQSIAARRRREAHPSSRVKQATAARPTERSEPGDQNSGGNKQLARRREAKLQLQLQEAIAACQREEKGVL